MSHLYWHRGRTQFKPLFCDNTPYKTIIKKLNLSWTDADYKMFLDFYASTDRTAKHDLKNEFSSSKRNLYIKFFEMGAELTAALNVMISNIVVKNAYLVRADIESQTPEDYIFKFAISLKPAKKSEVKTSQSNIMTLDGDETSRFYVESKDHSLSSVVCERIWSILEQKLENMGMFIQDVMDPEFITKHYGVSYSQFIAALAYLKYTERKIEVFSWFGSSILIKSPKN